MSPRRQFTLEEAKRIGETIGANWAEIPLEQFRQGLAVELEHGSRDPGTNVTNDDEILTGKIALAHLKEYPDYYDRLEQLEKAAEEYWAAQHSRTRRSSA
jgi:uncharacterized protein DUF5661